MVLGKEFRERSRPFVFPLKVLFVLLALYIFFEYVGLAHALETIPMEGKNPWVTFGMATSLFALDSVLPVPATVVAYANGHGLGIVLGSLGNILGMAVGSLVEYGIGRLSGKVEENGPKLRFSGLIWIAVSRWIPLASEATAIVSGHRRVPLIPFLLASIVGAAPCGILFAYLGSKTGF